MVGMEYKKTLVAFLDAIFVSQFDLEDKDELVVKFRNDFKNKFNKEPNLFSALSYDSGLHS